jgi:hypothetical protein
MDIKKEKIRKMMLEAQFKDIVFDRSKREAVLRKMNENKTKKIKSFKPVFISIVSLLLATCVFTIVFYQMNVFNPHNAEQIKPKLDTSKLVLEEGETKGQLPLNYKPIPLDTALKIIPFNPSLPTYIHDKYIKENLKATITDFSKGEDILISVKYETEQSLFSPTEIILFQAANFDRYSDQYFNNENVKDILLIDGTKAHFGTYDEVLKLIWSKNDIVYQLEYYFFDSGKETDRSFIEEQKNELIKIANQMKY